MSKWWIFQEGERYLDTLPCNFISSLANHHCSAALIFRCGTSYEVYITSDIFEGKRLLQRHQLVNKALAELMPDIHALSIKRTKTPAEMQQS